MYYFDYAATTPIDDKILEVYNKISKNFFLHPQMDKQTMSLLSESKLKILRALNLNEDRYEVIYTSGGTEANNLAVLGFAKKYESFKHFITTEIEHPSIYESFKYLEALGHEVTYLSCDNEGKVSISELESSIRKDTVMVSIMAVNNEIGTVQNIEEIYKVIKKNDENIIFLSDVVQAVGKNLINYNYIDMMSISAHKLYGPKACGCLLKKKEIDIKPITYGGYSLSAYRSGTDSLALQVALSYAVSKAMDNLCSKIEDVEKLMNYMIAQIEGNDNIEINNSSSNGIININLNTKALSETLLTDLQQKEIYVSTKAACSSKSNTRSRILQAIDIPDMKIDRSMRISISHKTTIEDIDVLIAALNKLIEKY